MFGIDRTVVPGMTTIIQVYKLFSAYPEFKSEASNFGGFKVTVTLRDDLLSGATVFTTYGDRFTMYGNLYIIDGMPCLRSSDADVLTLPCSSDRIAHIRLDWLEAKIKHLLKGLDELPGKQARNSIETAGDDLQSVISGCTDLQ